MRDRQIVSEAGGEAYSGLTPVRYFTYIAEKAFVTTADGRRLFYRRGILSRPYLVPNAETERRLFRKQLWLTRIFFGAMILCNPIVLMVSPSLKFDPLWVLRWDPAWFFVVVGIATLLYWIVSSIVFRGELEKLSQAESRVTIHDYCAALAAKQSFEMLLLSILMCFAFVGVSYWLLSTGFSASIAWLMIGLMGLNALILIYAFILKPSKRNG